jgi:hypothetical protein
MPTRSNRLFLLSFFVVAASVLLSGSESVFPGANSLVSYQQLRNVALTSEAVSVKNLILKRDTGVFHLNSGTFCFVSSVAGRVTGTVFTGDGSFELNPPDEAERASLKLLTKEDKFHEIFDRAVFRFTDPTYDELKKAGLATNGMCDAGSLRESQNVTRHELKRNIEARLLEDVLSSENGGYFVAFIHGKRYCDKELFEIDPDSDSDQVHFITYAANNSGDWASFRLSDHNIPIGGRTRIEKQRLDITIEKSGNMKGNAVTDLVAQRNGVRVLPFDLFSSLRVESVMANGQQLAFIQEDKHEDSDFAVILPTPLSPGAKLSITTAYSGKDAVLNTGSGNYYPVARQNWYPNQPGESFGHYTSYEMTLRIPKGMKMAATGVLVSEANEDGHNITLWKSEGPQTVAGFSFGRFKEEEVKLTKPEYLIQSYANEESPDWVKSLRQDDLDRLGQGIQTASGSIMEPNREGMGLVGGVSTVALNRKALAEAQLAVSLYSDYFGSPMFKHLQVTQQTACDYGQSWPELVWLPVCYYFDNTLRHSLGLDHGDRGYWKSVTAHEVAHQWWGHTVGFASGRDEWMSEGFSEMSASLYISMIEKNPKKFLDFWKDQRDLLLERNAEGFRAIDVGPVTMGYRASNSRTGYDITGRLIYPKGAYILHMVRMMMWDNVKGDQEFRNLMHDFVQIYSGRSATTEDFKTTVEKHMTPDMDLDGNHRMDWFFNEYVYGTALPAYRLESSFDKDSNGDVMLSARLTQAGVNGSFKMAVPLYLELADGRMLFIGRAQLTGNTTLEQKFPIRGLKTYPKRLLVNYNYDVLASN